MCKDPVTDGFTPFPRAFIPGPYASRRRHMISATQGEIGEMSKAVVMSWRCYFRGSPRISRVPDGMQVFDNSHIELVDTWVVKVKLSRLRSWSSVGR